MYNWCLLNFSGDKNLLKHYSDFRSPEKFIIYKNKSFLGCKMSQKLLTVNRYISGPKSFCLGREKMAHCTHTFTADIETFDLDDFYKYLNLKAIKKVTFSIL